MGEGHGVGNGMGRKGGVKERGYSRGIASSLNGGIVGPGTKCFQSQSATLLNPNKLIRNS